MKELVNYWVYISLFLLETEEMMYLISFVKEFFGLFVLNLKFFSLQEVEIVLTAHPTQINRRTLQYKHIRIVVCY